MSENGKIDGKDYSTLFLHLNNMEFTYILPLDRNRAVDGVDLRYRFGYEKGYTADEIRRIDNRPCSILEMMVAMAFRCEETIMANTEYGDRTGVWFWDMIKTLGLDGMYGSAYDADRVNDILERFLNREYSPDGHGGLFLQNRYDYSDMREKEIWYQMMNYLSDFV